DADDIDAIERHARSAAGPPAAEQRYVVTAGGQPSEDFVEMNLCPARLRVFSILPVDEQDLHRREIITDVPFFWREHPVRRSRTSRSAGFRSARPGGWIPAARRAVAS